MENDLCARLITWKEWKITTCSQLCFNLDPWKEGLKMNYFEAWETDRTALVISVQMTVLSARFIRRHLELVNFGSSFCKWIKEYEVVAVWINLNMWTVVVKKNKHVLSDNDSDDTWLKLIDQVELLLLAAH